MKNGYRSKVGLKYKMNHNHRKKRYGGRRLVGVGWIKNQVWAKGRRKRERERDSGGFSDGDVT